MSSPKKRIIRVALFTLLFIILFLGARLIFEPKETTPTSPASNNEVVRQTSNQTIHQDTVSQEQLKSEVPSPQVPKSCATVVLPHKDSTIADPPPSASFNHAPIASPPDLTPPHLHAEPGPGRHPAPIQVRILSDEAASILYRLNEDTAWKPYTTPIPIQDSAKIAFKGYDSAGNASEIIERTYIIVRQSAAKCPQEMSMIESGGKRFCMDKYEWPNKKGVMPVGFVNWYMAYDSCRAAVKRLCSSDEWELACGGTNRSEYPYGNTYEITTCNTETTGPFPSGSLEECRSLFGVYDLSGNLREWTATRAKNDRHYQVYGGFWDNRGASKCISTQYSFFPENKFIAIGFRCCQDAQ